MAGFGSCVTKFLNPLKQQPDSLNPSPCNLLLSGPRPRLLQARRGWQEIFIVMKSRDLQPRLLYPAQLSFRIEGQMKSFPDQKRLKFIITKPLLYEMLKELKKNKKIKTMNNKMAKIHIYQYSNLKNKLSKQEQRQNHGHGEGFDGCQMGVGCGGMGEEVRGLRSTNRYRILPCITCTVLTQFLRNK